MIKISVIISTLKLDSDLKRAIESVIKQDGRGARFDIEILVYVDSSYISDQECASFFEEGEFLKYFKDGENKGLPNRLNYLIAQASGDYIARLDADDQYASHHIDQFVKFIAAAGLKDRANWFYSCPALVVKGGTKKIIPNSIRRRCISEFTFSYINPLVHGSLIIPRDLIHSTLYDERFFYAQDYELYLRLFKLGCSLVYNNNPGYILTLRAKSAAESRYIKIQLAFARIAALKNYKKINSYFGHSIYSKFMDLKALL